MKLQIKTLKQKSLVVDIEERKTVYELKKELSLYPDIGVKPELQNLIYSGKVLANEDKLSAYNIDVKKFVVIMILKQPLAERPTVKEQPQQEMVVEETKNVKEKEKDTSNTNDSVASSSAATGTDAKFKTPPGQSNSKKEDLVTQIVGMGYTESDVRRALAASFYNPERAVEYLIEGVPTSPSTPEGERSSDVDLNSSPSPIEEFRRNRFLRRVRREVRHHPSILDGLLKRLGDSHPSLLKLINENPQIFLDLFADDSDGEESEEEDDSDVPDDEDNNDEEEMEGEI